MDIRYIDQSEQLEELSLMIRRESWIALDTEFLREKTYYPKFCLLQIATPEWVACVDPIAIENLTPLMDAIYDPGIVKVFHSCRQDLEIFFHLTGRIPWPIFDTQIAAPLLGFQENPGYAMLVSSFLNINLSKAHTRTDWSLRPLTSDQLDYAADDVIYLCQIYVQMLEDLKKHGRDTWLTSDFELLKDSELYLLSPENAWLRIRGKNKLTGRQLSVMQAICEWRERTVQQENKPRNWLLNDDIILELAKLQPMNLESLHNIRNINDRTVNRYGKKICELISIARDQSPKPLADKEKTAKKSQQFEAIVDVLTAVVRIRAEQNALNPIILATRKDLESLLLDEDSVLLTGWRYNMVGRELLGLLSGESQIHITKEAISIEHPA